MGEMTVGIASVGAGYTTFLGSGDRFAMLDFGAPSGPRALRALERFADHHHHHQRSRLWWPWWPSGPFSDLIVSHPHADHYSGLLHLAGIPRDRRWMPDLLSKGATFFHPVVPRDPEARMVVYFLMSLNMLISGLPENALGRAVAAVSAGAVRRQPLERGMRINVGDVPVDVLWPPPVLDEGSRTRLRRLVREYELVADEAAERGDERLIRAVEAVREPVDDLRVEELLYGTSDGPTSVEHIDDFSAQDDGAEGRGLFDDAAFEARVRRLRAVISQGANYLSLVLVTRPQRYVFLGDLDESLHPEVVDKLLEEDHEVILSAHHGTHFGSGLGRLRSRFVVSSVGGRLAAGVRDGYHSIGTHIRTDQVGDVTIDMGADGTHLGTCTCENA